MKFALSTGKKGKLRNGGQRAFTLIETLVAFAILGLVIFSFYAAMSSGFTTIRVSQEDVRADQILMQKLETLRVYHWTRIFTNGFIPQNFQTGFTVTNGISSGVVYDGTITLAPFTVSAANETYRDALRQVTVSVNWLSAGVPRTRSITTLVSQYGLQTYRY
jgi:prepilin-type N-terminal cleavage/methylation domain-containing protein